MNFGRINLGENKITTNKPVNECDDNQLIGMLADGEKSALSELMKRYRAKAINFAYRYLGDSDDAEDAAQDCFVKVYYNCQRFNQDKSFSPWFFTILVNCCRDRLRHRNLFTNFIKRFQSHQEIKKYQQDKNNSDIKEIFNIALMKLSPSKREIISLRFIHDLNYKEIAETLGVNIGTVMSRLFRAKKELEKILRNMGVYS